MRRRLGIAFVALMLAFPAAVSAQGNDRPRPTPPAFPPGYDRTDVVLRPAATTPETGPGAERP